VKSASIYNREN